MAVHLNADLKTRFIPILFSLVAILILTSSHVARASAPAGDSEPKGITESELAPIGAPADAANLGETQYYDHREVSDIPETSRIDRRPGFSPITVSDPYAMKRQEEPVFPTGSSTVDREELERLSEQPRDGQVGI
jgi:hypothetical protein